LARRKRWLPTTRESEGEVRGAFGWALLVFMLGTGNPLISAGEAPSVTKDDGKKNSSSFDFNKKDPIYITADWMEVDQKKSSITYKGRVVAIQNDMTMRSETLTAYYDPEMKQMKQIVAEGKVNAIQGNRVATGEKAVFDDRAKTVTLTGSPVMRQGNSQVKGAKIVYFIEQDKASVEGDGKARVEATVFPEELNDREKKDAKNE
jgi:lipopolysaccharide export system protein LptA